MEYSPSYLPSTKRVFGQCIQSRSVHFNTEILFVSFLPSTHIFYPYCPFLSLFGANHNGTLLPFRMWAGIQAAVSRADSKIVLQISHQDAFEWYDWQVLSSRAKHVISATGSAASPRNPSSFPSSGQSVGYLRDSSMPKEPAGSILTIF